MATLLDEDAYSGLERLLRAKRGEAPDVPMLRLLGIEIDEVEHGRIVLRCRPTEEHLNRVGTIHGGYTASVLDTAAALCFLSTHGPGERSTTVDLSIKYIRPLLPGMETLRCVGEVVSAGKRIGVTEARIVDDAGKVYAYAASTCLKIPASDARAE